VVVKLSAVVVNYRKVAEIMAKKLVEELGDKLCVIILYGSVAKGLADEDSDIDLFIVTENDGKQIYDKISIIRTTIDLDYGTLTSIFHLTKSEFEKYMKFGFPLLKEILSEGIVLYGGNFIDGTRRSLVSES
jgi:predicted nucleotidyltransferase